MKINKFLIAAIAATTMFASCSKNDGGDGTEGKKATLTINISNPSGRATAATPGSDNTVTNVVAFAFRSDGSLDVPIIEFTGSTKTANVTTAANSLYLVANAGASLPTSLTGITSKTALEAVIEDLDAQQTGRWATVSGDITFTQSGNDYSATFSQPLKFVSARITLNVENKMTNYNLSAPGEVVITDVAVLNAMGKSKLFGTSLVPDAADKAYYAGTDYNTGFANKPTTSVTKTYLKDAYVNVTATNYYYYSFENDATTAATLPTIVTLVGTYNGGAIYFPVHIAPYEQLSAGTASGLERGKSYDIKITLNGNASPGAGGGGSTTDPTQPVVNASVNVTVAITDWVPVAIEKEFQ